MIHYKSTSLVTSVPQKPPPRHRIRRKRAVLKPKSDDSNHLRNVDEYVFTKTVVNSDVCACMCNSVKAAAYRLGLRLDSMLCNVNDSRATMSCNVSKSDNRDVTTLNIDNLKSLSEFHWMDVSVNKVQSRSCVLVLSATIDATRRMLMMRERMKMRKRKRHETSSVVEVKKKKTLISPIHKEKLTNQATLYEMIQNRVFMCCFEYFSIAPENVRDICFSSIESKILPLTEYVTRISGIIPHKESTKFVLLSDADLLRYIIVGMGKSHKDDEYGPWIASLASGKRKIHLVAGDDWSKFEHIRDEFSTMWMNALRSLHKNTNYIRKLRLNNLDILTSGTRPTLGYANDGGH